MPSPTDRPHTCILTLQADRPGGVPTVVDWWHALLDNWGHRATTVYAAFEPEDIPRGQRLRGIARTWRLHERPEHPNPTLASAAPPFPLWLFYAVPQWIFGSALDRFDQIVVAGGPCLHALPLALRGDPYVVWMGTLYEDELRGKVLIGDQWAERVLNSPFWPVLAWQERFVLRRAARILPQSPYTLRRIKETMPEVARRVELAMVPVDTSLFRPLSSAARKGSPRTILNVSRINDPRKNIPLLLKAFARVRRRHPDIRLVLAGDDPGPALLAQADQLGVRDAIEFRGKVPFDELVDLYQRADVFAITSTQEGLGIVMVEAMACGTPVVATDCGGPEGIVIDGKTGRLVPNNDAKAFAAALSDLLDDPARLAVMREQCAAFIRERASRPVVERTLYRAFAQTFPDSRAAEQHLFDTSEPAPPPPYRRPRWREWLALAWVVLVTAAYVQHQAVLNWPSIEARIVGPLLRALR